MHIDPILNNVVVVVVVIIIIIIIAKTTSMLFMLLYMLVPHNLHLLCLQFCSRPRLTCQKLTALCIIEIDIAAALFAWLA